MMNSTLLFVSITEAPPNGWLCCGGTKPEVGRNHCVEVAHVVEAPTQTQTTEPSVVVLPYAADQVGVLPPEVPVWIQTWKLLFESTTAENTVPFAVH